MSWIVVNRYTSAPIVEIRNEDFIPLLKPQFIAVPVREYLAKHNQRIKDAGGEKPPLMPWEE